MDVHERIVVDTDRSRLDVALVHAYLAEESYWARGIPRDVVERAIEHSLCFGLYEGARQIGFARVITDRATFAYVSDVFVVASHRCRGHSKRLMAEVMAHPELQGLRRWMLITHDAHGLYEQSGFTPAAHPERMMERHDPDVYRSDSGSSRAAGR
jgi:GNAT superfamily N-acetyltransferase